MPRDILTCDGAVVSEVDGVRFRVQEWLDLDPGAARPPDDVGRSLALLHRDARTVTADLDPWYTAPPAAERWRALVRSAEHRPWSTKLTALLPHLLDLSSLRRPEQPLVLCHRDFVADNVIPAQDGGLVVLDWENAGPLEPEQELGYVLLWCPDALPAYSTTIGYQPTLAPESYATGLCTWLNFLAVQAEAATHPETADEQRAFADHCVARALAHPLEMPTSG